MERNTMYGEGLVVRSTRYAASRLSCIRTGELPRLHGLKDIAVKDVFAGLFYDVSVLRLGDVAGEVRPAG